MLTMFQFTSTLRALHCSTKNLKLPVTVTRGISSNSDTDTLLRSYQVVVAATREMGIGKNGTLPWKLQSDLNFFKKLTSTTSDPEKMNAVVLGRKTWDSIPVKFRPLPGRFNVVLTRSRSLDFYADNFVVCNSFLSALKLLAEKPYSSSIEKVFVIGGGEVLRDALNGPGCDAIHITEIETRVECDTFIPAVDLSLFRLWYSSSPLVENGIRFSFVTYVRVGDSGNEELNDDRISNRLVVKNFGFLPKMICEKHEFGYLRPVEEIISSGMEKNE